MTTSYVLACRPASMALHSLVPNSEFMPILPAKCFHQLDFEACELTFFVSIEQRIPGFHRNAERTAMLDGVDQFSVCSRTHQ